MTLLLLDGNGLAHRAYHSTKANPQYREDGLPVAAIGRFLDLVYEAFVDVGRPQCATHAAAIFDAPGPNWRHEIAATYKAGRNHDADFHPQLRLCRELVRGLGVASIQQRGYEADDLMATYARQADEAGMGACIVSIDKDLLQLIRPGISVYNPMKRSLLNEMDAIERFGVLPERIPCVQALVGDTTDGYAGITGVGPKAAAELIAEFGSLEALIENAAAIPKPALRAKIIAGAEAARACRRLALLDDDVPVRRPLDDLTLSATDPDLLIGGLKALGLLNWPAVFAERLQTNERQIAPHGGIADLSDELMEWAAA